MNKNKDEFKLSDEELMDACKDELTVQIKHLDWDKAYLYDKYMGHAIDIYERSYSNNRSSENNPCVKPERGKKVTKEKKCKKEKNPHGIMSQEFCTTWDDIDSFSDRYRCNCGELKGKALEGEVCEKCNTRVSYKDIDYRKTGWISLNGYKVIQPNYYNLLQTLIGETRLLEIITKHIEIDIDGNEIFTEVIKIHKKTTKTNTRVETTEEMLEKMEIDKEGDKEREREVKAKELKKMMSANPFAGKGLIWLSENILDVIYYFYKKNRNASENKVSAALFLIANHDKIFTSHIPVYSSSLRPEKMEKETYSFYRPNSLYNSIVTSSWILYDKEMVDLDAETTVKYDIEKSLAKIQISLMKLDELISNTLNGKNGFIISNILGGNYTYSSRCVIVPDPTLKLEEVDLPYCCFGELYKFEIMGHMCEMLEISESEAFNMWNQGMCGYDETMYQIMRYIVETQHPEFIVGRNPTINYGSMNCMKVRRVKKDYEDFSMSLNLFMLKAANADFDGDTLNILALKTGELQKEFDRIFNPNENHALSKLDGLFNTDIDLLKDSSIAIFDFCTIA